MRLACLGLLGAVCAPGPAALATEVHKWVDEEGNVHYSSRMPRGIESERVNLHAAPPEGASEEAARRNESMEERLDALRGERSKREQTRQVAREDRRRQEENCARARSNLESLQAATRRLMVNEEGDVVRLNEQERQSRLEDARQAVAEYCGD